MGSLILEIRILIIKAYRYGHHVNDIADMFDVHRWTVWKWVKRARHPGRKNLKDQSRKPHRRHRKIIPYIEEAILLLRDRFNWGTQWIKINLLSPPPYIQYFLETILGNPLKSIDLCR